MKILFVADPLERLKPQSDTSFALVVTALQRKHQVYWAVDTDIEYYGDFVRAKIQRVIRCVKDQSPELEKPVFAKLDSFKAVFIRKDPPFDVNYVRLCWILSLVEKKVWMLNSPSSLIRYHEKLIPLEAFAHGYLLKKDIIPTHLGSAEGAKEFIAEKKILKVVQKPFLGHGGTGVRLVDVSALTDRQEREVIQPFKEEVAQGDRRIFFLNGKVIGHFTRLPAEGDFISNLAHGGRAVKSRLSNSQVAVLDRLGKFLKQKKIYLAGADLIGTCISEVNITSPTGFRAYEALEGIELSPAVISFVERSVALHKR